MQDACPFVSPPPSCAIPIRQRGFYQDPVPSPCLATYFILSSCPTILCATPSSQCSPVPTSSTVVLLRASSLRPFTTLPTRTRPIDLLSHSRLHLRSSPRLHRRNPVN